MRLAPLRSPRGPRNGSRDGWCRRSAVCRSLFFTKSALIEALKHAGAEELEKLRAKHAKELEDERAKLTRDLADKRETFERDLQLLRDGATRELETFKSELTLAAEIRRQVAAKRVDALHVISGHVKNAYLTWAGTPPMSGARVNPIDALRESVTSTEHFLPKSVESSLKAFANTLLKARAALSDGEKSTPIMENASAEYHAVMAMLRRELGVVETAPAPTPAPPPPET